MAGDLGPTVLIVDDDDSREVYRTLLQVRGYEVLSARTGEEGRRLLEEGGPDLVLLDRKLPDMDGLDLLDHMDSEVQVICVSARAFEEDRNEALSAGVDCYLTKPVTPHKVLDRVEKMLGPVDE